MRLKIFLIVFAAVIILGGVFLFARSSATMVTPSITGDVLDTSVTSTPDMTVVTGTVPAVVADNTGRWSNCDVPAQAQMADPPTIIKGIYLTGWSAGSAVKMQSVINLIKSTELNAVVVDIKDYSGYVSYAMDVPEVKASGAEAEIRIPCMNGVIKELHDNGIYVIGRITNFQDPILAKAHPEWAMKNKTTGAVWTDNNGLAWMDPAEQPVRDYLASIAKDAFGRGFDEVNFDYVRFASDGSIGNISYPAWNETTPRAAVIEDYFKFLRQSFPTERISADLFGLSTVNSDDLGIGQVIQSAYEYFNYVCPMVYPSHYATEFLGYKYPGAYPYQVIAYSLTHGLAKLLAMGTPANASSTRVSARPFDLGAVPNSKLRPWLQDFNLGAPGAPGTIYTADMVRQEKQAVYDTVGSSTADQYYGGWMMWNAGNNYTEAALDAK
ncbi:MAG: putative glycoside hydrolase [Minisyncoccia bacterium]